VNFSFDILDTHRPIDSLQLHRMDNRISLSLSQGSYVLQNAQPYHGASSSKILGQSLHGTSIWVIGDELADSLNMRHSIPCCRESLSVDG